MKSRRMSWRQLFRPAALKSLEIRQYSCGFLPCRAKNLLAMPHTRISSSVTQLCVAAFRRFCQNIHIFIITAAQNLSINPQLFFSSSAIISLSRSFRCRSWPRRWPARRLPCPTRAASSIMFWTWKTGSWFRRSSGFSSRSRSGPGGKGKRVKIYKLSLP